MRSGTAKAAQGELPHLFDARGPRLGCTDDPENASFSVVAIP